MQQGHQQLLLCMGSMFVSEEAGGMVCLSCVLAGMQSVHGAAAWAA
jgi:hypothetical protein